MGFGMSQEESTRDTKAPQALTDVEYYILKAVIEQPTHGLGIFESVARQTHNQLMMSPEALYTALQQLYSAGWLTIIAPEEHHYHPAEQRKIYAATQEGFNIFRRRVAWLLAEGEAGRQVIAQRETAFVRS